MPGISLKQFEPDGSARVWRFPGKVRIGRLDTLEMFLNDTSVSRTHAEIVPSQRGWRIRDLQSTNGTFLNGTRLGLADWPLRERDVLKCGNITLVVEQLQTEDDLRDSDQLVVQAAGTLAWEDALEGLAFDRDRHPRPGQQLIALLRAGHHLGHHQNEEDLLHAILQDAVGALDAQQGAIVLAEGQDEELKLRALATAESGRNGRPSFSRSLAQRCFRRCESILCAKAADDPELAGAQSIADGAMSSVICVPLRTPRKMLGVLHLDRGPLQEPFSRDDLYLADALAANVSAGIESAQLLRRQREMFLSTITVLAQAIELKDDYTGLHTSRVTRYAESLARRLGVSNEELDLIRFGTPLHDIGKIGISDAILQKPGKLTPEEFEIMKTHTTEGACMLETYPDLAPILPIVRSHHERWDGQGYPDGLAGEAIPRLARIVAVADTFDAMTSDRPYRKGLSFEVALAEIARQSGKQFDPECAKAFLAIPPALLRGGSPSSSLPEPQIEATVLA
jgi:putative nucleotidyltransferase with HDIG domain